MRPGLLFDPPAKPRSGLCDEEIAVKVLDRLAAVARREYFFESDELNSQDRDDLIVAMMATNSDRYSVVEKWLRDNKPDSGWKWEHTDQLLEAEFSKACEHILPKHKRRGRFS